MVAFERLLFVVVCCCLFFVVRGLLFVFVVCVCCLCLRVVFRTCSCVDFSQSPVLPCLRSMLDATQLMGWGGVGWDVNVPCTCTHVGCYAIGGVGC